MVQKLKVEAFPSSTFQLEDSGDISRTLLSYIRNPFAPTLDGANSYLNLASDETEGANKKYVESVEQKTAVRCMADSDICPVEILENSIRENSRLARYRKECPETLNMSIFPFMRRVFEECKDFLRTTLRFTYPKTDLEIVVDPEEWTRLRKRAGKKKGERLNDMAFSCGTNDRSYAIVFMNFQNHCLGKTPTEFIANISVSYLEELFHVNDPSKKHKDFAESLCSAIEGFLEIKLEDKSKQALLRRLSNS